MNWLENLHKNLSNVSNNEEYEDIFWNSSNEIMNNYMLRVDNGKQQLDYFFTELEYYFFDSQKHPDPYVHKHCLQLKSNEFYIHEMSLNRSGADLTFGNGNYFGGILIRGLQSSSNNTFFPGPAVCLIEIITNFTEKDSYHDIQKNSSFFKLIKSDSIVTSSILRSTRYGINKSFCDTDFKYLTKLYRFVKADNYFKEKQVKEKTKLLMCTHSKDIPYATQQIATIQQWKNALQDEPLNILWNKIKDNFPC